MASRKLQITAVLLLLSTCALVVLKTTRRTSDTEKAKAKAEAWLESRADREGLGPNNPNNTKTSGVPKHQPQDAGYTMGRLSEEHDQTPTDGQWVELTQLLLHSKDDAIVEAVTARFALHAGTAELAVLADAYDDPPNDNVRQRLIELFSCLQNPDSMDAARQILTHQQLPITDHLVCACAISLIRFGEPADLKAVFGRLNSAGEDPLPEGSLYSEADGLMFAISEAEHPRLQPMLMQAARGHGAAMTGRSRYAALAALRNYTNVPSTEVLYRISKHEQNPRLRKQAAAALKKIQTPD